MFVVLRVYSQWFRSKTSEICPWKSTLASRFRYEISDLFFSESIHVYDRENFFILNINKAIDFTIEAKKTKDFYYRSSFDFDEKSALVYWRLDWLNLRLQPPISWAFANPARMVLKRLFIGIKSLGTFYSYVLIQDIPTKVDAKSIFQAYS